MRTWESQPYHETLLQYVNDLLCLPDFDSFFVYIEYLLQVPAHKGHEVSKDRCKYAALNSIS